jgi:hypothetical protein
MRDEQPLPVVAAGTVCHGKSIGAVDIVHAVVALNLDPSLPARSCCGRDQKIATVELRNPVWSGSALLRGQIVGRAQAQAGSCPGA